MRLAPPKLGPHSAAYLAFALKLTVVISIESVVRKGICSYKIRNTRANVKDCFWDNSLAIHRFILCLIAFE